MAALMDLLMAELKAGKLVEMKELKLEEKKEQWLGKEMVAYLEMLRGLERDVQ
jgi:ribosomal protein L4